MDISKYISELLFLNERVVVPGLGVFTTKYIPSKINTGKQTIEPPKKEVLFTSAIKHDKGELIKYISEKENINKKTAAEKLEKIVNQWNSDISTGKKVNIEKIGILSKNNDGTFSFKADRSVNYFDDAFGFGEFEMPMQLAFDEKNKISERKKTVKSKYMKKTSKKLILLYVLIPVAAVVILGIVNYDLVVSKWNDIFYSHNMVKKPLKTETQIVQPESNKRMLLDTLPANDTALTSKTEIDTSASQNFDTVVEKKVKDRSYEHTVASKKFYIVAGSFSSRKNAEKLVEKLKKKGYDSEIFGQTRKGLIMVSYDSFNSKREALTGLKRIVKQENPNAWIIEY